MKTIRVDGTTSIGAACCNVGSKKACLLDVWRSSVASGGEAEDGMKTIGVDDGWCRCSGNKRICSLVMQSDFLCSSK